MKRIRRAVAIATLAGAGLLAVYVGVVVRFSRPELTETQLFLSAWPWVVLILALLVVAGVVGGKG